MIQHRNSPEKYDKLPTSASHNKNSHKLGNTLGRYLYENSYTHHNVTFTSGSFGDIVDELHRTVEEIVGAEIAGNARNP